MQGSGRIVGHAVIRLSRSTGTTNIRRIYSRPPPTLLVSSTSPTNRGYRRTALNLKDDDDKRHKLGKDAEKQTPEESGKKLSETSDQDAKVLEKDSMKEKQAGEVESTGSKEKRTKESKTPKT